MCSSLFFVDAVSLTLTLRTITDAFVDAGKTDSAVYGSRQVSLFKNAR